MGDRYKHGFSYGSRHYLDKRDLAGYGFADGERFAFLETENGLIFSKEAYSSIANATTLAEIEDYIETMLESPDREEA